MSGVFPTAPQNPDTGPTVALTLAAEEKARTVRGRTRGTVARRTDAIVSQSMWEESLEVRSFAGITRDTCTRPYPFSVATHGTLVLEQRFSNAAVTMCASIFYQFVEGAMCLRSRGYYIFAFWQHCTVPS